MFAAHHEKKLCPYVFKVPNDHLLDNLESGKKEIQKLFWPKKSLEEILNVVHCMLKSVKTLLLT